MGRDEARWGAKKLRAVFPMLGERREHPRFDGAYLANDGSVSARFHPDGRIDFAGVSGTWRVDQRRLWITTPEWQCEGALDLDAAYLLCQSVSDSRERPALEMRFTPESAG